MKKVWLIVVVAVIFSFLSCSKKHTDLPTSFKYDPLPAPYDLAVEGGKEEAVISWRFAPDKLGRVKEFRIYQYIESYDMLQLIGTTADTTFTDTLLIGNLLYCYKVSAVDSTDFEGWRSEVSCAFVRSSE